MIYSTADFGKTILYSLKICITAKLISCGNYVCSRILIHYKSNCLRFRKYSISITSFFTFYVKRADEKTTTQLYKPVIIS